MADPFSRPGLPGAARPVSQHGRLPRAPAPGRDRRGTLLPLRGRDLYLGRAARRTSSPSGGRRHRPRAHLDPGAPAPMSLDLRTALRLGRVSNLPTVWTNVLAGIALAGGDPTLGRAAPLALAVSLFYVAGMFLNDAFDVRWDKVHRPERPIPAGEVDVITVFTAGFGLMAAGLLLLAFCPGSTVSAGFALCVCIVIYDATHKANPLAPVVMGLCRVLVYVIGGQAVSSRLGFGFCLGAALL